MHFSKSFQGVHVEEICQEFRYANTLKNIAGQARVTLMCKRDGYEQIIISVNVNDNRATDFAFHLVGFFRHDVYGGSALYELNKTTTNVVVERYTVVENKDKGG